MCLLLTIVHCQYIKHFKVSNITPSNTTGVPLKQILMESTGELVNTSVEALRPTSVVKVI